MTDGTPTAIRDLTKSYGKVQALRGASMTVPPGPVGLLGPNGAGKTTLIKVLLGLLVPDGGSASIVGLDPRRKADRLEIRKHVGYMPEGDCLLPGMTGIEVVSLMGRLTGMRGEDAMTRAHESLDYVGLEEQRYREIKGYSTGMKQRLKLAQALVHDPQMLLLDEPTNGLDPGGRVEMLELISNLGRVQGKNVLLCSHLLPDVEKACDHVIIIREGQVVEQGSMAELTRSEGVRVRVALVEGADRFQLALQDAGLESKLLEADVVELRLESPAIEPLFELAARAGLLISRVDPVRSTLEQVFLRAVGFEGRQTLEESAAAREAIAAGPTQEADA